MDTANLGGITKFSHGEDFLAQAIKYLEKTKTEAEFDKSYQIKPGMEVYNSFLSFFIEELENLPFDDKIEKSIAMRSDARGAIARLIDFLKKKLTQVSQSGKWTNDDLSEIEDIFEGYLDVFKNEIYPKDNIGGICYNIYLSRSSVPSGKETPAEVMIERSLVTNNDGFKVVDHGFLKLDIQYGSISIDLEKFPTRNIHVKN